jgi:hypothetical protein
MNRLPDIVYRSWAGVEALIEAGYDPDPARVAVLLRESDPPPRVALYLAARQLKRGRPRDPFTRSNQWEKAFELVAKVDAARPGRTLTAACKQCGIPDRSQCFRAKRTIEQHRPLMLHLARELTQYADRLAGFKEQVAGYNRELEDLEREIAATTD